MIRRILLTVPNLDPTASPWREAMGLARYLPRGRFELTICALREDGVRESTRLLEALGVKCFVARFRPRGRGLGRLLGPFFDRGLLGQHGQFDVQHSMDFTSSPLEAMMSRRQARRFVFSQRNMNEDGHRRLLKLKARFASRIICVSEATRQMMLEYCPHEKLVRIYPGLEMDQDQLSWRTSDRPRQRPLRVLMVALIAPRKRFQDGIRAVAQLTRDHPYVHLDIAGEVADPGYLAELQDLIRRLGIVDRVTFLGARDDVFELMRGADVLLHTAGSEAFGMVVIEAMALGLPVIAPALQGPQEIIEHQKSGLLVAPGDVPGYVAALHLLMQSPDVGAHLAFNARQRVGTHFSAQRMAEEMAGVYESLCFQSPVSTRDSRTQSANR